MRRLLVTMTTALIMTIGLGLTPAQAASGPWYWTGFTTHASCHAALKGIQADGARILTYCQKRSYDRRWAFSYRY